MTEAPATIGAIVWDLDETLIREESAVRAAFTHAGELAGASAGVSAEVLGETARECARRRWRSSPARDYCLRIGISSWEGLWGPFGGGGGGEGEERGDRDRDADEEAVRTLRAWLPEYRIAAWTDALAAHGIEDASLAEAMAGAFHERIVAGHVLYDDARDALGALRDDVPMALLTNGASGVQRRKVRTAGIGDCFRAIVVSGEVGAGKPDPRPFAEAARRLGLAPARLVMIGDSLERDVRGAIDAGFRAIWLDRSGVGRARGGEAPAGVLRIEGLAELDHGALRAGRIAVAASPRAGR